MKRIYKFRAWLYGLTNPEFSIMKYSGDDLGTFFDHVIDGYKYELMQFTGLKDSKGVEIYEGDICTYNSRGLDFNGYVVSNGWEFYYEPIGKFSKDYDHMSYPPGSDIEVIGNIYSNPELL